MSWLIMAIAYLLCAAAFLEAVYRAPMLDDGMI
jgi:hypothetical protein